MLMDAETLERKRRRDRLVKLHRFLGSNVPAGVILGTQPPGEEDLPPPSSSNVLATKEEDEDATTKWWKALKSGKEGSQEESGKDDWLLKDPMTEQDRVLNVKRKAKMEQVRTILPSLTRIHIHARVALQVFGARPPQGLYVVRTGVDATSEPEESSPPPKMPSPSTAAGLASLEFLRHSHSLDSLSYLVDKVCARPKISDSLA